MIKKMGVFLICLFFLGLVIEETADAGRRFGGGKSFGSKPAYQQPGTPQRQVSQPAGGLQNPASRGLFGGMGGMLGGFLMGGLLGSLLFGGAGFSGPGLLDLLLIGGAFLLLLRIIKSRRMPAMQPAGGMPFETGQPGGNATDSPYSGTRWGFPGGSGYAPPAQPNIPQGFDVAEFLKGAKAAYTRLQSSWDNRNMDDLRHFTSPEVMDELQREAEQYPAVGKTELLSVKAELLEVRVTGDEMVASVLFDVLMRENADQKEALPVQEIWHFRRNPSVVDSCWILEGIQQTA